jgi:hypothetical protein
MRFLSASNALASSHHGGGLDSAVRLAIAAVVVFAVLYVVVRTHKR